MAIETQENDLSNCDRVAPLIPLLRLYGVDRDEKLLAYAVAKFNRYLEVTPRYKGCLVNFAGHTHNARAEILFQVCPGLLWLTRVTGDPRYAEVALDQFEKLHRLLYSEEVGLWRHGVNDHGATGAFWARGMAFSLLGVLQVLELTDPRSPQHELGKANFQQTATRVRDLQDESGFWFQLVDSPATEKESSGTAWAGAAIARGMRLGYLDASYRACADAAWQAVKSRVWQGFFPGHATATTASASPAYYLKKQLSPSGWSHFAFRLACELHRSRRS